MEVSPFFACVCEDHGGIGKSTGCLGHGRGLRGLSHVGQTASMPPPMAENVAARTDPH